MRHFFYQTTGKQRRWDAIKSHSSIGVVVYHKDLKQLLIVRQFRPPVYATLRRAAASDAPPDLASGFTYELCAGILDKDKSLEEVACEEIEVRSSVANVPALGPHLIDQCIAAASSYRKSWAIKSPLRQSKRSDPPLHQRAPAALSISCSTQR